MLQLEVETKQRDGASGGCGGLRERQKHAKAWFHKVGQEKSSSDSPKKHLSLSIPFWRLEIAHVILLPLAFSFLFWSAPTSPTLMRRSIQPF